MKFSIIIPCYGQAKYLKDAITSALSQTYTQPYEIIVVDDGSNDGSLEIAKEYEPRIKVIKQINKGLAAARNAGIMNASGEYILPLDADDMLLPNCLQKINGYIPNTPYSASGLPQRTYEIIAPSIRCIDEATGESKDTILMKNPTTDDFKEGNRLAYCSAIRRSVLLECGGYSPRYDALGGWEDLALWYDLMARGKNIITIQEPLVVYRVKENSMWKDAEKNKDKLWDQLIKDFPHIASHRK